ncbi:MAG: hypothetical protein DME19_18110 [Verrucomicrobia bacterium]|nr:MAG: hypothetical protein DME19_18110 [Verrucomicrobiota bacterium]
MTSHPIDMNPFALQELLLPIELVGVSDDDRHLVAALPIAAPEIVRHDGRWYVAALRPGLKGIRVSRLEWVPPK